MRKVNCTANVSFAERGSGVEELARGETWFLFWAEVWRLFSYDPPQVIGAVGRVWTPFFSSWEDLAYELGYPC